jgi:HAD superfamily hydrolase (TIGR01484 family)
MQIIYTDLDGTLRDEDNFLVGQNIGLINRLQKDGFIIVLLTARNRTEVEQFEDMNEVYFDAIGVENGSAIGIRNTSAFSVLDLQNFYSNYYFEIIGFNLDDAEKALDQISMLLGHKIFVYEHPSITNDLRFKKEFSICFTLPELLKMKALDILVESGYAYEDKGSFLILSSRNASKGNSIKYLQKRALKPITKTYGIGNRENDVSMLSIVDHPLIVINSDGVCPVLQDKGFTQSSLKAPDGFAELIDNHIGEISIIRSSPQSNKPLAADS